MMQLALYYNKGPILLKDICKSQEISLKYLSQLVIPLKIAGLIKTNRGSHGGYFLAKPPEDIKLSDIVKAVEGSINPVECVDNPEICDRSKTCAARNIWADIGQKYFESLKSYTLKNMIEMQNKLDIQSAQNI